MKLYRSLSIFLLIATFSISFIGLTTELLQPLASDNQLFNSFQYGLGGGAPDSSNEFSEPIKAQIVEGPWALDNWNNTNSQWLSQFTKPVNQTRIPYIYLYHIAGKAKADKNIQDCNFTQDPNNTLCKKGAKYIRENTNSISQAYTNTANQIKTLYGTTRPILLHFEPDFYQYAENSQEGGALTPGQASQAMNTWTRVVKSILPNSSLVMDISPWNKDLAGWSAGFENFQYGGLVGKRFSPNGDGSIPAGIDNKTYAQISQLTGKKLILNDAHGAGGYYLPYNKDWENRSLVNARWNDGVVAVIMPPNDITSLSKAVESLIQEPIPKTETIQSSTSTPAKTPVNLTSKITIGKEDLGTTVRLSACVQNTGVAYSLAEASLWFNLADFSTAPVITTEGRFNTAGGYSSRWIDVETGTPTNSIWGMEASANGNGVLVSTTPELYQIVTLTKTGANPIASINQSVLGVPEVHFFSSEYGLQEVAVTTSMVTGNCLKQVAISSPASSSSLISSSASTSTTSTTSTLSSQSLSSSAISTSSSVSSSILSSNSVSSIGTIFSSSSSLQSNSSTKSTFSSGSIAISGSSSLSSNSSSSLVSPSSSITSINISNQNVDNQSIVNSIANIKGTKDNVLPRTGATTIFWGALLLFSGIGLIILKLARKNSNLKI